MTDYTVRTKRQVKNLDEGHLWLDGLPESMFLQKFNFDGDEYGPISSKDRYYELFWYPKTLKSAVELLTLLDKHNMTASLEVLQDDSQ